MAYDLKGLILGVADSIKHFREIQKNEINEGDFLGKWHKYYVYWNWNWNENFEVILKDLRGNKLKSTEINKDLFGGILYYNFPLDHVELESGKIYHLSQKGDDAVITVLPLEELFPDYSSTPLRITLAKRKKGRKRTLKNRNENEE